MRLSLLLASLAIMWCVAFPLVGLAYRLQTFADAGLFAYAVAAGDSWAFHWHNISGRAFAWAWASLPGEWAGRLSGNPAVAVAVYGALWFAAPAVSLALTTVTDRSDGRAFTLWAAASTALVLPFVFGFPTELWVSHAAFWPALALLHAPGGAGRRLATLTALMALVLSHEGGVVWAVVALATLLLRPAPWADVLRAAGLLAVALIPWAVLKIAVPPAPDVALVLASNASNFLNVASLLAPVVLLSAAAVALHAVAFILWRGRGVRWPGLLAFVTTAAALGLWWLVFDTTLHAWDRYYLRTLVLGLTPTAALAAVLHATGAAAALAARFPAAVLAVQPLLRGAPGTVLALTLVHAVETAKLARAWTDYRSEVAALATGAASDPALGDPALVSARRLSAAHDRLGWHSTTPFLSVLVAPGMAPSRLVADDITDYFWFTCPAAEANRDRPGPLPRATRDLVTRYICLDRCGAAVQGDRGPDRPWPNACPAPHSR